MRKERSDHTLQTTALVNEAYVRLVDQRTVRWQNRAHFFAIAAQMMRRILIDHARKRASSKGGGAGKLPLEEAAVLSDERAAELVALDEGLVSLAAFDERKSKIVEMRFFGGLSVEEIAHVMGVSVDTISREWRRAKAWLYREIQKV